jgi:hypothetical protein
MEAQNAKPRTVRRRLAALSSLFNHLIEHHITTANPTDSIKRPKVNLRTGVTKAFSAHKPAPFSTRPTTPHLQDCGIVLFSSIYEEGRSGTPPVAQPANGHPY